MVGSGAPSRPFFTIGLTTYKRRELLRQTLDSILAQNFADFELIVGNDDADEQLNAAQFGVSDPRVRFVNHPRNLQEVGNLNALLSIANGRYFTWMADDDLYEPNFLSTAHDALAQAGHPEAFYSTYGVCFGTDVPLPRPIARGSVTVLTGREFLDRYFTGRIKVVPLYGVFDTNALRQVVGGVEELCPAAVGLYGEYIFLVRCGQFPTIVYSDAPLVIYRNHMGAWGVGNMELEKYREAGVELVRRCGSVLRRAPLSADLTKNLLAVCYLHLHNYTAKLQFVSVLKGNFGVGAMYSSISKLFAQAASVRRVFVEAGGVNGMHATLTFAWIRCKGSLMIIRYLLLNWLRRPVAHD